LSRCGSAAIAEKTWSLSLQTAGSVEPVAINSLISLQVS
jgi:hypothetical protein